MGNIHSQSENAVQVTWPEPCVCMFTFRTGQFSEVFLNINPFLTYMGSKLYMMYVTFTEVIDPVKFHMRTHSNFKEFDKNSKRDWQEENNKHELCSLVVIVGEQTLFIAPPSVTKKPNNTACGR